MTGGTKTWRIPEIIPTARRTILRIVPRATLRTELPRTAREIPRRTVLRITLKTATARMAALRAILRTARETALKIPATISDEAGAFWRLYIGTEKAKSEYSVIGRKNFETGEMDMAELETIAFRELNKYKNDRRCVIIDLRSRQMYEEGHLDGAWNIPYEHLMEEAWKMLPRGKLLLLYCERGGAAMMAGRELAQKGFHVKAAVGGFEH